MHTDAKIRLLGEIPHKLCGLAHWCEEVARKAARQCLEQWDRLLRLANECQQQGTELPKVHRLSKLFLSAAGTLRSLVVLFADGGAQV